jgi:hypothetical protein
MKQGLGEVVAAAAVMGLAAALMARKHEEEARG